jgi:DNA-binding CsgD family transcriptional regulator
VAVGEAALALAPTGISARMVNEAMSRAAAYRGDPETAARYERQATGSDLQSSQWAAHLAITRAHRLLAAGDAAAMLEAIEHAMANVVGEPFYAAPACSLGGRAAADLAESARDLHDDDAATAAAAAARALADQVDELLVAAPVEPETAAHRAQLEAELGRAEGTSDPELWAAARTLWEERGMRPGVAYCEWRRAEALVARGDRAGAAEAMARAHEQATATGYRPVINELEALARRSRIALAGHAERKADVGSSGPESAAERLGLTDRELDVLRLVVEGRTNRQIGDTLFISGKTASVHVSRILAKLDAGNRGEAAAIARRLGLVET